MEPGARGSSLNTKLVILLSFFLPVVIGRIQVTSCSCDSFLISYAHHYSVYYTKCNSFTCAYSIPCKFANYEKLSKSFLAYCIIVRCLHCYIKKCLKPRVSNGPGDFQGQGNPWGQVSSSVPYGGSTTNLRQGTSLAHTYHTPDHFCQHCSSV